LRISKPTHDPEQRALIALLSEQAGFPEDACSTKKLPKLLSFPNLVKSLAIELTGKSTWFFQIDQAKHLNFDIGAEGTLHKRCIRPPDGVSPALPAILKT
jgi:hypothetical protein